MLFTHSTGDCPFTRDYFGLCVWIRWEKDTGLASAVGPPLNLGLREKQFTFDIRQNHSYNQTLTWPIISIEPRPIQMFWRLFVECIWMFECDQSTTAHSHDSYSHVSKELNSHIHIHIHKKRCVHRIWWDRTHSWTSLAGQTCQVRMGQTR